MSSPTEVTIKPPRLWRVVGSIMVIFGLLFGLAGIGGDDVGATGLMLAFGLLAAAVGLSLATAAVHVDGDRVLYRHGWTRRIRADEVVGVRVGRGSGAYYDRVALFVDRRRGRPVRLTALQQPDTVEGRERLSAHAAEIERGLGRGPRTP